MHKPAIVIVALLFVCENAGAHVAPNVQLVRRGDFLKESLPVATSFFERPLSISDRDRVSIRKETGWSPSDQNTRVYVGRDREGHLVGSVIFLWISSKHGPIGIGAAFAPDATVHKVAVTDVPGEALPWVRPLIEAGGLDSLAGLVPNARPDPEKMAPGVSGAMPRYYARVIADGVVRAQVVERLAREK